MWDLPVKRALKEPAEQKETRLQTVHKANPVWQE